MEKSNIKIKNGFSILEVLIAFFVLIVGILAILIMISNSIMNSASSRDVVSASQLSQEGIELVRWLRDDNVEGGDPFDTGMQLGIDCTIDLSIVTQLPTPALTCVVTPNFNMYYDATSKFTTHASSGTTPLKFKRKIVITNGLSADEKIVKSFVFWGPNWTSSSPDESTYESTCIEVRKCVYSIGKITNWDE